MAVWTQVSMTEGRILCWAVGDEPSDEKRGPAKFLEGRKKAKAKAEGGRGSVQEAGQALVRRGDDTSWASRGSGDREPQGAGRVERRKKERRR